MRSLSLFRLDLRSGVPVDDAIVAVDPSEPLVRASDLGVNRGDGIFETAVVRRGRAQALDAHLDRFARSAALLDLPEPRRDLWDAAVRRAAEVVSAPGVLADGEVASVKFVMTRGDEFDRGEPHGWVLGIAGAEPTAVRDRGVAVVLLDRGYRHDVMQTSPWLLQGAKTLAYAVHEAAIREAVRRGAQDVVFTSADGYVLEGPRSTLVARIDGVLVTPVPSSGVLPGTTQADAFGALDGLPHEVRLVTVDEFARADAAWLCSSTRGAVPVNRVDDVDLAVDAELTARMNRALDEREA